MLENGDNVEICYLDFIKAYDKLDYWIMITKLKGKTGMDNKLANTEKNKGSGLILHYPHGMMYCRKFHKVVLSARCYEIYT